MTKINLTGMSLDELEDFVQSIQEKPFRSKQLFAWLYRKDATSFDEMSDLSKRLRLRLNEIACIGTLAEVKTIRSTLSATQKFLFQLSDGERVESVYIPEGNRQTICLSSQVGCALGCTFCTTGKMKFRRNLETWEIISQLQAIQRKLKVNITNVVIMGMGEPFLNYENVIRACHLMNHPDGPAIGHRRIVISTSGIVPAIRRYADEKQPFKLAISLNAPTDYQRDQIMPINKKYPLRELINAAKYYSKKSRLRITFEYVLIADFNDRDQDALQLRQLLKNIPYKINIIPYNESSEKWERPSEERINRFVNALSDMNAVVSVRWSKGADIQAACGQLVAEYVNG